MDYFSSFFLPLALRLIVIPFFCPLFVPLFFVFFFFIPLLLENMIFMIWLCICTTTTLLFFTYLLVAGLSLWWHSAVQCKLRRAAIFGFVASTTKEEMVATAGWMLLLAGWFASSGVHHRHCHCHHGIRVGKNASIEFAFFCRRHDAWIANFPILISIFVVVVVATGAVFASQQKIRRWALACSEI